MFFKKKAKKVEENQKIEVRCDRCTGKSQHKVIEFKDLKLRPTGYKGRFQVYIFCNDCKENVTITYESLPDNVQKALVKKWLKQF